MQFWLTGTARNHPLVGGPTLPNLKKLFYQWIVSLARILEYCGAARGGVPGFLKNLFYKNVYGPMVAKEIEASGLVPGKKALHIGCGSFPYTALALSSRGLTVDALECDRRAAAVARELIWKKGGGKVAVFQADGREADCSCYDAVWVSLHVFPRKEILENALASLPKGSVLLYRNPHRLLTTFYPVVAPDQLTGLSRCCRVKRLPVFPGCETVLIHKFEGGACPHELHA